MTAIRWRFTAGCALFAFVVAGLSSLLGGNPLGTTLVRAIVAAVLFGAVGTAARLVISSVLPELEQLFSSAPESAIEDADGVSGGTVDIVVDDDELDAGDAFSGEPGDENVPSFDSGDSGDEQPAFRDDDLVADAVPVEAESGETEPEVDPTDSVDPKGVDTLPDVGGFADTFEAPESIGMGEGERERSGSSDQDPAMMARALQTMLKRDA